MLTQKRVEKEREREIWREQSEGEMLNGFLGHVSVSLTRETAINGEREEKEKFRGGEKKK